MKFLYLMIICLYLPSLLQAQVSKTLEVTAGNLSSLLTAEEKSTLESLTLMGTIDANDLSVIQNEMPLLTELDMSLTTMSACSIPGVYSYPDHWFPGPSIGKNEMNLGGLNKPLLISLKLPSQLEILGSGALSHCSGLTSITIPPTVTTIGWSAFENCTALTSIEIPSSVTYLDQWVFSGCSALTEISIPSSITYLPRGIFQGCSSLSSMTIPTSVIGIDMDAFSNCISLTTLILPAEFMGIEEGAFFKCTSLSFIYSHKPTPPQISSGSFPEENYTTCTVYVPFGSKALYTAAEGWQDFTNIEEMPGLSLSANAITIEAKNGSTGSVLLSSNASWTVSADQSWLEVSPTSGNGDETLTFTADRNNTGAARTATVSVSLADGEPLKVIVTQEANNPNQEPVANAGVDQSVNERSTVTLDGSASSDPDHDELTYLWTAPEGIELSSATSVNPTFTAPEVNSDTDYTFSLVVNDGTVSSTADEVVIAIRNDNRTPVARAGEDQFVNEGSTVTLDGSASSDPDDDELTYLWTAPEGIELSSATSVNPNFIAPQVNVNTEFTFSLVVNDGTVSSTADEVVITVRHNNRAPVANAGEDQSVNEGATVTLDGSASSDPDDDELTYRWTAPEGIELSSATSVNPTFTAPEVSTDTDFTFTLVVNDGTVSSTADEVVITVRHNNRAPVANAGEDQSVNEGATVTLDGWASFDPDEDDLTYLWMAPEGIELSSATSEHPTFIAPQVNVNTEFTFSLVVNDGTVSSAADEVAITVRHINRAPVANAGEDQSVNEGATVALDGSASSDPDDDGLTYRWTAPEGIELSSATSVNPTFTAPEVSTDTDFTFTLMVNDGTVSSAEDEVVIHVEAENNAPIANAGIDLFVHEGALLTLDGSGSYDPDDDLLTYQWTAPEGITLSGNSVIPTFTVPEVDADTVYTFSLIVSDGEEVSPFDQVAVNVLNSNINQHFSVARIGNEDEQMNFYVRLARINGLDLQEGDEIAIFDGLTCVGAAVIRQVLDRNNNLCIKVYMDNPGTFIKDGFITGHSPTVRIWNSGTNKEAILQVFDYEPGSSEVFEVRGRAIIAINAVVTGGNDLFEGVALLGANYPNPFSSQTTIPYVISRETKIDISIYDITGRKINTLVNGFIQPGDYTVTWNKNAEVKPGVYICKMETDDSVLTKLIMAE